MEILLIFSCRTGTYWHRIRTFNCYQLIRKSWHTDRYCQVQCANLTHSETMTHRVLSELNFLLKTWIPRSCLNGQRMGLGGVLIYVYWDTDKTGKWSSASALLEVPALPRKLTWVIFFFALSPVEDRSTGSLFVHNISKTLSPGTIQQFLLLSAN